jgi:hypothetical protein
MGRMKDLLITIHNGGDEAVEAAVALAGMEKQKRAYDVMQSAPDSGTITDIVTVLRGLSFATNSPDAHESASLLHYCVNHAADELEQMRGERRWIPVQEQWPKHGSDVLVAYKAGQHVLLGVGEFDGTTVNDDGVTVPYFKGIGGFEVTHWMPLPEPPVA